jgi:urease accessory protein
VKGHLHLTCSLGTNGLSYLREQSFKAPLHLSKPHLDEDTLVVNIVTPTAGIFDDDEVSVQVTAEAGASILLTTPSSARVFRSRSGNTATLSQRFEVKGGAFLEYYPEPFIPHAGARYRQQTQMRVAEGGQLLQFEWLTPGRVASGEVFLYDALEWHTDVHYAERLVARERYRLSPHDESLQSLRLSYDKGHYLSCYALGDFAIPAEELTALNSDEVFLGFTALLSGGWTIKAICASSLKARATLQAMRKVLHKAMNRVPARLGRH